MKDSRLKELYVSESSILRVKKTNKEQEELGSHSEIPIVAAEPNWYVQNRTRFMSLLPEMW